MAVTDPNALNYAAILAGVLGTRFPANTQTTNARRWISVAYADVWNATEWTFRRADGTAWATGSTTSPGPLAVATPADFNELELLLDDVGVELEVCTPEEIWRRYGITSPQKPEAYAVSNRQILLGPPPATNWTYTLSYKRRLASRTSTGVVQAGFFKTDNDYPLWDDHHNILIPRAQEIGMKELNDGSAWMAAEEYGKELEAMMKDYADTPETARQYGRWSGYR